MPTKSAEPDLARIHRKKTRSLLAIGFFIVLWSTGLLTHIEVGMIHGYRSVNFLASPFSNCRYRPSCSAHALEVLEDHGFTGGNLRIARQLMLCSPLGAILDASGFDTGSRHVRPPERSVPLGSVDRGE